MRKINQAELWIEDESWIFGDNKETGSREIPWSKLIKNEELDRGWNIVNFDREWSDSSYLIDGEDFTYMYLPWVT